MATKVITNGYLLLNAVDLSDHVQQISVHYEAEQQDDTAMGDTTRSNKPGLKVYGVDVTFFQDYTTGKVDATLFPLVGAAGVAIEVRSDAGARSVTNPAFTGTCTLQSYDPITGKVGDMQTTQAKFVPTKSTMQRQTS